MTITLQNYRDPEIRRLLALAARRERSRQLAALFQKLLFAVAPKRPVHAARSHLARQG